MVGGTSLQGIYPECCSPSGTCGRLPVPCNDDAFLVPPLNISFRVVPPLPPKQRTAFQFICSSPSQTTTSMFCSPSQTTNSFPVHVVVPSPKWQQTPFLFLVVSPNYNDRLLIFLLFPLPNDNKPLLFSVFVPPPKNNEQLFICLSLSLFFKCLFHVVVPQGLPKATNIFLFVFFISSYCPPPKWQFFCTNIHIKILLIHTIRCHQASKPFFSLHSKTLMMPPLSHCWRSGEPRMLHAGPGYGCTTPALVLFCVAGL